MSVAEKDVKTEVRGATIALQKDVARRRELESIRREQLAVAQDMQRLQKRLLSLSQRVFELTTE